MKVELGSGPSKQPVVYTVECCEREGPWTLAFNVSWTTHEEAQTARNSFVETSGWPIVATRVNRVTVHGAGVPDPLETRA